MIDHEPTGSMSRDGPRDRSAAPDAALLLVFANGFERLARGVHLGGGPCVVGRSPVGGGLALDVQGLSRSHLTVEANDGRFTLKDLGSRNGTFVGGKRVEHAELSHGDVIRAGDAVFVLVTRDGARHLGFSLDGKSRGDVPAIRVRGLVGGYAMARLSREVEEAVASRQTVLLSGDTGVGKELVARGVHEISGRAGPFVALNCAAIPEALFESELFGHVRGAFTGATRNHPGLVRSADGGTLFLDEIGDMPLGSQAKLLRFLETREVIPIGETRPTVVDVRVVSATHRDLGDLVAKGAFRADLYARLFGYTVRVPAVRERKEDLFLLLRHALKSAGADRLGVTATVMERMALYDWPFNVRELFSVVGRAASLADGDVLRAEHFPEPRHAPGPAPIATAPPGEPSRAKRPSPKKHELEALLAHERGNVSAVARTLERDAALVYRWLKQHGLDPDSFRSR
jgi:DNA-binding NtrC family response regulator